MQATLTRCREDGQAVPEAVQVPVITVTALRVLAIRASDNVQALELHANLPAIGMFAQNVDDGVGIKSRRVTGALLLIVALGNFDSVCCCLMHPHPPIEQSVMRPVAIHAVELEIA